MSYTPIPRLAVGDRAPDFELEEVRGADEGLRAGDSAATVVVVTSNECPFALAWHSRIEAVGAEYADRRVRTLLVFPNDTSQRPGDGQQALRDRLAAGDASLPHLIDADQRVARAYAATATPEVFVIDAEGVLRYRGAPDADHDDESQHAQWVRDALDDVLAGRAVRRPTTNAAGCSIKWRVDLLWWDGCPSHGAAEDLLTDVLADLGREEVSVRRRQIRRRVDAEAAAFTGSPTFQVGGVDLFPTDAAPGLSCRIYEANGRVGPLPTPDDLAERIKDVLARPWDLPGFVDLRGR